MDALEDRCVEDVLDLETIGRLTMRNKEDYPVVSRNGRLVQMIESHQQLGGCSGIVDGRIPKLSRLQHRPRNHLARQRSSSILPSPVWNLGLPPSTSSCLEAHVVSLCLPIVGTPRSLQPRKRGCSNCARRDCNCRPRLL